MFRAICFGLLLSSCLPLPPVDAPVEPTPTPTIPLPEPVPETPPAPKEAEGKVYPTRGWHEDYDALIIGLVTPSMLGQNSARMDKFCPHWGKMDMVARKKFYADLLFSITYPESNYNNLSMYIEDLQGTDALTGLPTVSEGLLQLSYTDKRGYPACDFDAKKDLAALKDDIAGRTKGGFLSKHPERDTLQPIKNLTCGVAIVDKLLRVRPSEEFAPLLGRYWSTIRVTSSGYKKILQKMSERKSECFAK